MNCEEVKNKIRRIMKARRITQKEMADKIGVTQNMISLYLAAKSPGLDKILLILQALEISPADFFKEDETTTDQKIKCVCPYCGHAITITIQ